MKSYWFDRSNILKSWFLTTDHKRIAWLYLASITLFFLIGGFGATLLRLELFTPEENFLSSEMYNRLFTMHGIVMVWFFLIPSIPTVFGNFLLPLMLGAKDLVYPRLNLLSWYVFMLGACFTMYALIRGGVDTGWTFYTPYSTAFSNSFVIAAAAGVFISGFSSIFTGINFIATIHYCRAKGMTAFRMPLFVWSMYATSLVMILATPVLTCVLGMIILERFFGIGLFDPAMGGDPLLFQHLFWFYSHPAVYIMILPAMGVVSELIATFTRKPIFGYKVVAMSSMAIALLGFLVWGHHMFTSSQSPYASVVFSFLSMAVAIPSAVKVFNWIATLYKGAISLEAPMLYAMGFVGVFTIGGLTGTFVASLGFDVHVHDTYFVVAHFHYIMVGGAVMAYMGALHLWWPKMVGKMYPERWAQFAAVLLFFGFNLTFFPQFILGFEGNPRRYHTYPEEFQFLHQLSSFGALFLAGGYILPAIYLTWSIFKGKWAGKNPWKAPGLEWTVESPPSHENFDDLPEVQRGPYEFQDWQEVK